MLCWGDYNLEVGFDLRGAHTRVFKHRLAPHSSPTAQYPLMALLDQARSVLAGLERYLSKNPAKEP